jgi:cytochrome c-type biogenesis protein
MSAAISANPLGVLAAFGAGILSFLSPCVLPLVPGYVSMVSGLSAAELTAVGAGSGGAVATRVARGAMLRGIGLFVGGFTVVFVALGATASGIGRLLKPHQIAEARVSGSLIVVLGAVLVVSVLPGHVWARLGAGPRALMTRLTSERRFDVRPSTLGTWAAPVMGMAFAFAWTPCIGPVLGAVLQLASSKPTLAGGVLLLFAYSLGLAVPFVATGLAFGRATSAFARVRRRLWAIELFAGLVLVGFGVLLLTDNIGWVSVQLQHWLTDIGLGRLSTS